MQNFSSAGWHSQSRGFWTKRKRTATSLFSILALVAGIAVAFKLFDRQVPNNVVRDASTFAFEIYKKDVTLEEDEFVLAGPAAPIFVSGVDTFPGDEREVEVKLANTNSPARDASFHMHVDQTNIVVRGCTGIDPDTGACATTPIITAGSQDWTRFVNLWEITVDKQDIYYGPGFEAQGDDHRGENFTPQANDPDGSGFRQYSEACQGTLRELIANNPCNLGRVKAAGSNDALGESLDVRYYRFTLTEADDGSDQSAFKGWTVTFSLVFNARVPPAPESSSAPVGAR